MNGLASGLYSGDRMFDTPNDPWVEWTEQATIVGWSVFTTKIIRYKVVGNMVFVMFSLQGTSNSATTSFTLPYIINNGVLTWCYAVNNGTAYSGDSNAATSNTNVLPFGYWTSATVRTTTWTASGNKQIIGQMYYQI